MRIFPKKMENSVYESLRYELLPPGIPTPPPVGDVQRSQRVQRVQRDALHTCLPFSCLSSARSLHNCIGLQLSHKKRCQLRPIKRKQRGKPTCQSVQNHVCHAHSSKGSWKKRRSDFEERPTMNGSESSLH